MEIISNVITPEMKVFFIAYEEKSYITHGPKVYIIDGHFVPTGNIGGGYFKSKYPLGIDGCIPLSHIAITKEEVIKKLNDFYMKEIENYKNSIKNIEEKMSKEIEYCNL